MRSTAVQSPKRVAWRRSGGTRRTIALTVAASSMSVNAVSSSYPSSSTTTATLAGRPSSVRGVALQRGEALGLVPLEERVDHLVEVPVEQPLHVREVVAEALVGDAVLREVVGAHLLRALRAADLGAPSRALPGLALLDLGGQEPRAQHGHRLGLVLQLRAVVLAGDHEAGRKVRDPDRGVRGVDALPALAAGAVDVDLEVTLLVDDEVDLLRLGQDGDGGRRGVDAALRLGGGDALHAMDAGLELEAAVGALPGDADDDLLEAALLALALREDLRLPALALRVAPVHAV